MCSQKSLAPSSTVSTAAALTPRQFDRSTPASLASTNEPYAAIDAYVEQQMRRLNIPGVSLAIVEGDQIVHLRGFGRARPGGEAPSPQTPFVLGSTTKSFSALAIMQLVEAGKIELDAPVQRYLPWFRVADLEASAQMTVRHLLHQTSGLPGLPGMSLLADLDNGPDAAERQLRGLSTLKLTRPVGSAFEYSNLNYSLLGLIVEAASGQSYAGYIQHHIFTPLGMSHSYTSQAMAKQNGLAVGHRYWFAVPFALHNPPLAFGSQAAYGLISSAEDMAHYLIAQFNGGRYGDAQILSREGIDELHRDAVEAREMGVSFGQYGMGWFITAIGPTKAIWHSGNTPDFSSCMVLLPAQKKGVVLLVNADHYGLPIVLSELGLGAAALLDGQQPAPTKLGFLPWAMRALLLIPLAQIAGITATLGLVRQWRQDPALRPLPGRLWGRHILLPLIPNLLVALTLIPMLGKLRGYLMLFNPDFSWVALICGSFAGVWAFLRTGLMLWILRAPSSPRSFIRQLAKYMNVASS